MSGGGGPAAPIVLALALFGAAAGGATALPAAAQENGAAAEAPRPAGSGALTASPGIAPLGPAQAVRPPPSRPRRRPAGEAPTAAARDPATEKGRRGGPERRQGYEPAPVPNRAMEAPRPAAEGDHHRPEQPSLAPSILYKNLPTPNRAAEGAPNYTEERLFAPAPGARLKVPFSY